jgi:hypothetical protein
VGCDPWWRGRCCGVDLWLWRVRAAGVGAGSAEAAEAPAGPGVACRGLKGFLGLLVDLGVVRISVPHLRELMTESELSGD